MEIFKDRKSPSQLLPQPAANANLLKAGRNSMNVGYVPSRPTILYVLVYFGLKVGTYYNLHVT